jgi:type VI secretion system protein ImpF
LAAVSFGGHAPLFDRLAAGGDSVKFGLEFNTVSQVEASVQAEVAVLVNTRSRLSIEDFLNQSLTVVDWGVPDFTSLSSENEQDRRIISRCLSKAIQSFEPRLTDIQIDLAPAQAGLGACRFGLQAALMLGQVSHRISFSVGER